MISFHVELGFLAWLPHLLMDLLGDNPSRFPFCSLCIHGSFPFPGPFIIIGKDHFQMTWLETWYIHFLCQVILLASISLNSDRIFIHLRLSVLWSWKWLAILALWSALLFSLVAYFLRCWLSLSSNINVSHPLLFWAWKAVFGPDHFSLFFLAKLPISDNL